jgi:hypothetical protein
VICVSTRSYVLEGHFRSITPCAEGIYQALTDKETDGDTDCNLNHAQAKRKTAVVLLHGAVVVSSEPTSLGEARLECERSLSSAGLPKTTSLEGGIFRETHTGTRKSTPVTIEVKAVPRDHLEYMFPKRPMTRAPAAGASAPLSDKNQFEALFAV